jgi:hypothetical protein
MKPRLQLLAGAFVILFLTAISASAQAVADNQTNEDTETTLIDAKVVEVTETRISVFARDGVEHVIAINRKGTKVMIEDREVSLQDVREGDVISIELDEENPVKFAKNISMKFTQEQVARNRR